MRTFQELLDEHRNNCVAPDEGADPDVAIYLLALSLGIIDDTVNFATDFKHIAWSRNALGDELYKIINRMLELGILKEVGEEDQLVWDDEFDWQNVR